MTNMSGSPPKKRRLLEVVVGEDQSKLLQHENEQSGSLAHEKRQAKDGDSLHTTAADKTQQSHPVPVAASVAEAIDARAVTTTNETTSTATTTTVYIGGLHPRVQEAHLEKLLTKFGGPIEKLDYLPHRNYAFCEYKSASDAQKAMSQLHGRVLLGRTLKVQPSKRQQQQQQGAYRRSIPDTEATVSSLDSKIQALKRKLHDKRRK